MNRLLKLLAVAGIATLGVALLPNVTLAAAGVTAAGPSQTEVVLYVTLRPNTTQEEVRTALEALSPTEVTFISEEVARVSFPAGSVEDELRAKLAGSFGVAQVSNSDPSATTTVSPTQTVPGIDEAGTVVPGFESTTTTAQSENKGGTSGGSRALIIGLVGAVAAVSGGVLLFVDQRRRRLQEHPEF
jgi:hypothetical protein